MNASREGLAASQSGAMLYVLVYCFVSVFGLFCVFFVFSHNKNQISCILKIERNNSHSYFFCISTFSTFYPGGKREREKEPNYEEEEQALRDVGALGECWL